MKPGVAGFLRVGDAPELAAAGQLAGVADLATHLGVTGRVSRMTAVLSFRFDDFDDLRGSLQRVEADELGGRGGLDL